MAIKEANYDPIATQLYCVVQHKVLLLLEVDCNKKMVQGWKPTGGVTYNAINGVWMQAFYKDHE